MLALHRHAALLGGLALTGTASALAGGAGAGLPPPTPTVVSISGGLLPAHVDYVRLTYVVPGGESAPSAEVPNGVAAATLTETDSPPPVPGALGYDVYAAVDNGDSDSGHVLQNDRPIPFGTAFVEPAEGWRRDGRRLAPARPDRTVEAVPAAGTSLAVPRTPSIGGNVVFARSDAAAPATVTVTTRAATAARPGAIGWRFDRTVRFDALPDFSLIPTREIGPGSGALLAIDDRTAGRRIATLDAGPIGPLTFEGGPWHAGAARPYTAIAGHAYEATLLARPASVLALAPATRGPYDAGFAGLHVRLEVPASAAGSAAVLAHVSAEAPYGIPALPADRASRVVGYASVVPRGGATYDGDVVAEVGGAALAPGRRYALAAFDTGAWIFGWSAALARATLRPGGRLRFDLGARPRRLYARRYAVALYEEPATPAVARARHPSAAGTRPVLASVGDSVAMFAVVPPSAVRCGSLLAPSPNCQGRFEDGRDFVTLAGERAGYDVVSLASPGSSATLDAGPDESELALQVPQIPRDAAVVVFSGGRTDAAQSGGADVSSRVDAMAAAIRATAPRARIVFVGLPYFGDAVTDAPLRAAIDAWDGREAALGRSGGAFLDLRPVLPAGPTSVTPDGTHLAQGAETVVADPLYELLRGLRSAR